MVGRRRHEPWLANQSAGWGGGRLGKAYGGGRSRRLVHSNRAGGEASRRSPTCRMKPRHFPRRAASGWSPAPRAAWDGCAVWWNGELAWHACARPAGGDWTTVESEGCGPGACAGDAGPSGGARLVASRRRGGLDSARWPTRTRTPPMLWAPRILDMVGVLAPPCRVDRAAGLRQQQRPVPRGPPLGRDAQRAGGNGEACCGAGGPGFAPPGWLCQDLGKHVKPGAMLAPGAASAGRVRRRRRRRSYAGRVPVGGRRSGGNRSRDLGPRRLSGRRASNGRALNLTRRCAATCRKPAEKPAGRELRGGRARASRRRLEGHGAVQRETVAWQGGVVECRT